MKDEALMKDIERMIGEHRFSLFTSNTEIADMINNYYKIMVRPYAKRQRDSKRIY